MTFNSFPVASWQVKPPCKIVNNVTTLSILSQLLHTITAVAARFAWHLFAFNSFPVASPSPVQPAVAKQHLHFQFFPSCFVVSLWNVTKLRVKLSILSQLLLLLLQPELASNLTLSILSQLLPTLLSITSVHSYQAFNSFPVASVSRKMLPLEKRKTLSILSQLLPAVRDLEKLKELTNTFQFFPSCFIYAWTGDLR